MGSFPLSYSDQPRFVPLLSVQAKPPSTPSITPPPRTGSALIGATCLSPPCASLDAKLREGSGRVRREGMGWESSRAEGRTAATAAPAAPPPAPSSCAAVEDPLRGADLPKQGHGQPGREMKEAPTASRRRAPSPGPFPKLDAPPSEAPHFGPLGEDALLTPTSSRARQAGAQPSPSNTRLLLLLLLLLQGRRTR